MKSNAGKATQDSGDQKGSMSNIGPRNGGRNGLILKSSNNRSTSWRSFSNGRHICIACIAVGSASVFVSVVTGTFVSAFVIVSSFAIGLLLLGGFQPLLIK